MSYTLSMFTHHIICSPSHDETVSLTQDIFQGTWCPSPRDCSELVLCVENQKIISEGLRPAYFQYLNDAPGPKEEETIQDFASDPTKVSRKMG